MTCSSEVGVGPGGGGDIRLETVFFSEVGVGRGGGGGGGDIRLETVFFSCAFFMNIVDDLDF